MELFELEECPKCRGVGMLMDEGGWNVYVECQDCGAQTAYAEYDNEDEKAEAMRAVVRLWNMGKAIRMDPGE